MVKLQLCVLSGIDDLNNWCNVVLFDIISKIMSIFEN